MLAERIKQSPEFATLPHTEQIIQVRLAEAFSEDQNHLYHTPEELVKLTHIGNKEQWQQFLNKEIVRQYIRGQMASLADVAQRKAFQELQKTAAAGNVQAMKEINEISGIMNNTNNHKIIVLHKIERPK